MAGIRDAVAVRIAPALPRALRERFVEERFSWSYADLRQVAKPRDRDSDVRLLIAPTNSASQGFYWARAAETLPGVHAQNMVFGEAQTAITSTSDWVIRNQNAARYSLLWARRQRREILRGFTHVLYEAEQQILGGMFDRDLVSEIRDLQQHGVAVGLVSHGSDTRRPSVHVELEQFSPFRAPLDGLTKRLEALTEKNHRVLEELRVPTFVSTPDLLTYVPGASWLPTLTDPSRWEHMEAARLGDRPPVVLHVPSRSALKGTASIVPAMQRLRDEGLIECILAERVPYEEMPALVARADVVIDQVSMGLYGVASVEAMFAGRLAVAEAGDRIRDHIRRETGLELPIVEANPETIYGVLRHIAEQPEAYTSMVDAGKAFAHSVHAQTRVATALEPFLGA